MTISKRVQKELVQAVPAADVAAVRSLTGSCGRQTAASRSKGSRAVTAALAEASKGKAWTREEHERFLVALDLFPSGPWKAIADYVGSKNSRQTMTHAQKYRQKHERRQRGLRNKPRAGSKSKAKRARTPAKARVQDVEMMMSDVEDQSPRSVGAVDDASSDSDSSASFTDALVAPVLVESAGAPPPPPPMDWSVLFKQASVTEIFPEFEPVELLSEMWSTNSLEEMVLGGAGGGRFDLFSAESHTAVV